MPTYYDESIDPHDPDDDAFNDKLTPSHTVQSVQHKLNVVKPEDQSIPKPKSAYILVSIFCLLTAFGGFVFGWDTGTISGFLNMTDFQQRFGEPKKDGTGYQFPKIRTGLVVGIFNVGCAIGGVFLSKLGDMWGRRKGIMSIMVLYIGGIAIQISSNELWIQYMIGRIISGLAVGGIAVIVPMFISETSPKQIRGTLVSCYQLMITIGIFAGYCTTYGTKSRNDSTQWRIPLGLCFLWAIFLITGMILMPESPRFLVQKGMLEKARQSLARINRVSPEDTSVYAEIEEIDSAIDFERSQGKATWGELITGKPKIFKRVFIGVVVQSLQQLTGANYFFYYGTTIFNAIGMDDSFVTSMILGAVNFITTFGGLYIVDRYGRRKALMGGSMLMFSCMCVFAAVGVTKLYPDGYDGETSKAAGNVMILFTCLFITGFATTWAPIAWVVVAETYPVRIRSKGMSIANAANWLWGFVISFFTPFITESIHFYYGFIFAGCLLFSIFFVFMFVPETKGLTLEQVDEMYASGVSAFKSASWDSQKVYKDMESKDYD